MPAAPRADPGALAPDRPSPARQRMEERRRQREAARPWITVPEITVHTLRERLGEPGLVVLNVTCRKNLRKLSRRIPGSRWEVCSEVDEWAPRYDREATLAVYCACRDDKPRSARVVQRLRKLGFQRAFHVAGGWDAWLEAGYPTEPLEPEVLARARQEE